MKAFWDKHQKRLTEKHAIKLAIKDLERACEEHEEGEEYLTSIADAMEVCNDIFIAKGLRVSDYTQS